MSEIIAYGFGALTATVGLVVFTGPHLRMLRDQRVELRKANIRLSDELAHATRGRSVDWGHPAGVSIIDAENAARDARRAAEREARPLVYAHVEELDPVRHPDEYLPSGTPLLRFDDVREG